MVALVVLLAVVVGLLTVLVIGLLRSYGEVLRRLHEAGIGTDPAAATGAGTTAGAGDDAASIAARLDPGVAPPRQGADEDLLPEVADVAGVTPSGDAVAVGVRSSGRITLLAFLSSGCGTCAGFWAALRGGERLSVAGTEVRVVVITGGPRNEQPAQVAILAGPDRTVVMSDEAWQHYAVPATPYFVLVDGGQGVLGEGSAMGWTQLVGLLQRAVADRGLDLQSSAVTPASAALAGPGVPAGDSGTRGGPGRAARTDAALRAAGIEPGDARLYRSPLGPDGAVGPDTAGGPHTTGGPDTAVPPVGGGQR
jgi:hypothetical protein